MDHMDKLGIHSHRDSAVDHIDSYDIFLIMFQRITDDTFSMIKSFFEKPFNFSKIRNSCKNFVIIHSDNDKIVPIKHAHILRENLGAKLVLEHKGHFTGTESRELPVVLEEILRLTG